MNRDSEKPSPPFELLVIVHWDDSFGGGDWIHKEDYKPHLAKCVTAGILIEETAQFISVTSSQTIGDDGQYMAPITIPKSAITRMMAYPYHRLMELCGLPTFTTGRLPC